jgi:hypothetical protein
MVAPAASANMHRANTLAGLGHRVLPLCYPDSQGRCACGWNHTTPRDIGKAPRVPGGKKDASRKAASIFAWWTEIPDANVGLALEPTGLVMLDPDSEEAQAEVRRLGLPPTLTRASRNTAYIYKLPEGVPAVNLTHWGNSKTIDILAVGYAVAYGTHRTGAPVYLEDIVESGFT